MYLSVYCLWGVESVDAVPVWQLIIHPYYYMGKDQKSSVYKKKKKKKSVYRRWYKSFKY